MNTPTLAEPCRRAGCGGQIVDGFCDTCGLVPTKVEEVPLPPPTPLTTSVAAVQASLSEISGLTVSRPVVSARIHSERSTSGTAVSGRASGPTRRRGFGAGLVMVPDVNPVDPTTIVLVNPEIPELDRFCASCGEEVGRSKAERPGRLQGFCPSCRHPFDLAPKLSPGDLVGNQYEVAGCLAHGGFGWIYLARDRNVSNRWVVLKGVIDSGNDDARSAALAERHFLATMEHPEIVKIYNFVAHHGAEYIVMEYIGGKSLKTLLRERREANKGEPSPLPLEQALAYIIGILPALAYLHDHGFVFCDFKPDNVIHQGTDLKLIDLGGVRTLDDPDGSVYGTVGYQAPEIAQVGPSITSDVYTVVRTLAVLVLDFRGFTKQHKHGPPSSEDHPLLVEFDSLRRLFERGTAEDPDARFQSVDELSDQLTMILREVVSVRTGFSHPGTSELFSPDLLASQANVDVHQIDWRALPLPLVVSSDPAASFVVNMAVPPFQVGPLIAAAVATGQVPDTIETRLRVVRAELETGPDSSVSGEVATARLALEHARAIAPDDWRLRWYEGLVALAHGKPSEAIGFFDAVWTWHAGEIAPRLALAYAFERCEVLDMAEMLYDRSSLVDPSHAFAVFGLGRVRLARGNRSGAVAAYGRVPRTSLLHEDAGISEARALLGAAVSPPGVEEVKAAAETVDRLSLDAKRRAELRRDVLKSALAVTQTISVNKDVQLFGQPFADRPLRFQLEAVLRQLASQEPNRSRRIALVDQANRARPRTLW